MKAVIIGEDRSLEVRDVAELEVPPGHVRLEVTRCGICGSDLHMPDMPERFPTGTVMGHEITGRVTEIGDGVTGWTPGSRVAAYHSVACGSCSNCTAGRQYMCERAAALSLGLGQVPGGYAETVVAPVETLFAISDGLDDDNAALAEPLAIGMHGVAKAQATPDVPVLVLGGGPIGVMTATALRFAGHRHLAVVEPNVRRRQLIERLGIPAIGLDSVGEAAREALGGQQAGAVIECSGNTRALSLAVDLVGYQGRVVVQGRPSKPVEVSQTTVLVKEVEVVGAVSCTAAEFAQAVRHLEAGELTGEDIVTDTVGLDEVGKKFSELLNPDSRQLKVLVAPAR